MNLFSGPGKATGKGGSTAERAGSLLTRAGEEQQGRGYAEWKTLEDDIPLPEGWACGKRSGPESGCQERKAAGRRGV